MSRRVGLGVLILGLSSAACGSSGSHGSGASGAAAASTGTGGSGGQTAASGGAGSGSGSASGGSAGGGASTGVLAGSISTLAGAGSADGTCQAWGADTAFTPLFLGVDGEGNVYVTSDSLDRLSPKGDLTNLGSFGTTAVNGLAVMADGTAFYSQTYNMGGPTQISQASGSSAGVAFSEGHSCEDTGSDAGTPGIGEPAGMAADDNGNLYVADEACFRVRVIDSDGGISTLAGTGNQGSKDGPGAAAELSTLGAITISPTGVVYVWESDTGRIRQILPDGTTSTVANYLRSLGGLAADAHGNVYFSASRGNAIRKLDSSGSVTTIAGNGTPGYFNGTLGPDGTTEFNSPAGLGVDGSGHIYVADNGNCYVRVITLQ